MKKKKPQQNPRSLKYVGVDHCEFNGETFYRGEVVTVCDNHGKEYHGTIIRVSQSLVLRTIVNPALAYRKGNLKIIEWPKIEKITRQKSEPELARIIMYDGITYTECDSVNITYEEEGPVVNKYSGRIVKISPYNKTVKVDCSTEFSANIRNFSVHWIREMEKR